MAKNNRNLIDFDTDPAVADLLGMQDKKKSIARMPHVNRKRYQREQAKAEARAPRRFGVDVDEDLIEWCKDLADKNSCPASQLVQLAMQRLMDDVTSGKVNLRDYRVITNSNPRYEFRVERFPFAEMKIKNV